MGACGWSRVAFAGFRRSSQVSMMKTDKDPLEVYYQCGTCQFVLKQKKTDFLPSYCPNCAIHHMKGIMIPVEEISGELEGPMDETLKHQGGRSNG